MTTRRCSSQQVEDCPSSQNELVYFNWNPTVLHWSQYNVSRFRNISKYKSPNPRKLSEFMLTVMSGIRASNLKNHSPVVCNSNCKLRHRMTNSDGFVSKRVKNRSSSTGTSIINGAVNTTDNLHVVWMWCRLRPLLECPLLILSPTLRLFTRRLGVKSFVSFLDRLSLLVPSPSKSSASTWTIFCPDTVTSFNSVHLLQSVVTLFQFLKVQLTDDLTKSRRLLAPDESHQHASQTDQRMLRSEPAIH